MNIDTDCVKIIMSWGLSLGVIMGSFGYKIP